MLPDRDDDHVIGQLVAQPAERDPDDDFRPTSQFDRWLGETSSQFGDAPATFEHNDATLNPNQGNAGGRSAINSDTKGIHE